MKFTSSVILFLVTLSLLPMVVFEYPNLSKLATAQQNDDGHFNFVAAGDWGCGNDAQNTFAVMKKMEPELYLGLGDYSYESTMDCWYDIVESVGSALKVVVGNHDTEGSLLSSLMDKFKLADQYYSFDYRNTHFLALSSELNSGKDAGQLRFADNDLNKARSNVSIDWIVVYFHRPIYSGSGMDYPRMRDMYHPLFDKYDVDLVLQGHAHNYQRSYPLEYNEIKPARPLITEHEQSQYHHGSGTVFAVVGTGGESIQSVDKKPYLASMYEGYGCLNVEVNDKSMTIEYYSNGGDTIDNFIIMKNKNDQILDTKNSIQSVGYDQPIK
jgi:predicted phosphodiesterase